MGIIQPVFDKPSKRRLKDEIGCAFILLYAIRGMKRRFHFRVLAFWPMTWNCNKNMQCNLNNMLVFLQLSKIHIFSFQRAGHAGENESTALLIKRTKTAMGEHQHLTAVFWSVTCSFSASPVCLKLGFISASVSSQVQSIIHRHLRHNVSRQTLQLQPNV